MGERSIESVLIVDDDPGVTGALKRVLCSMRLEVFTAANRQEALLAVERKPDLSVVDVYLADEDGLDLIVELKRSHRHCVVVLGGRISAEDRFRAGRAGADILLEKPCSASEILHRARTGEALPHGSSHEVTLAAAVEYRIDRALADSKGNISEASRRLQISRWALQKRLRKRQGKV